MKSQERPPDIHPTKSPEIVPEPEKPEIPDFPPGEPATEPEIEPDAEPETEPKTPPPEVTPPENPGQPSPILPGERPK